MATVNITKIKNVCPAPPPFRCLFGPRCQNFHSATNPIIGPEKAKSTCPDEANESYFLFPSVFPIRYISEHEI